MPPVNRLTDTLGIVMFLAGLGICLYLLQQVSPFLDTGQDNIEAIALMFLGLFLWAGGGFTVLSRQLQNKWPVLTGRIRENTGLRQGVLAGVAACMLALLAIYDLLDSAMALTVVFLALLVETFLRNRRAV